MILIVEDDGRLQRTYFEALTNCFEIIGAYTVGEARQKFKEHFTSLELVVMDACVPGSSFNTKPLVEEMRIAGFKGPIMANSNTPYYRELLMKAGCDIDPLGKDNVPNMIRDYFEKKAPAYALRPVTNSAPLPDNVPQ